VRAAQVATLGLMLASSIVTYYQKSIAGAWTFLMAVGAGTGSILILRWFWWRINAWSEVSAMCASFVVSIGLQKLGKLNTDDPRQFAWTVLITVAVSTLVWLVVTRLTPPEQDATLLAFYRRVRPNPTFWGPIARKAPDISPPRDQWNNLSDWLAGCAMIYLILFGLGKIICVWLLFGNEKSTEKSGDFAQRGFGNHRQVLGYPGRKTISPVLALANSHPGALQKAPLGAPCL
jgi:hypothetical protein